LHAVKSKSKKIWFSDTTRERNPSLIITAILIYIYIYIAKILANRTIELKTRRLEIKEKPAEPGRKK
jgi:hypothetical protein